MAITRTDFFDKKAKGSLWDVGVSIKRGNPLPLDADSVFESLAKAQEYAAGVLSYPGQIIAVVDTDKVTLYKLDQNCNLIAIEQNVAVDDASIAISAAGQISLKGFVNATAGQQLRVVNKGTEAAPQLELEFFTPDSSTVSGLQTTVGQHTTDIEALQATTAAHTTSIGNLETSVADRYTKAEVDAKVSSAVRYKSSVDGFADLPTANNAIGDMYNIKNSGGKDTHGYDILAGDNVIWNGKGWDKQAGYIDTTGFATNDSVTAAKEAAITAAASDATTKANAAKEAAIANTTTQLENYTTTTDVNEKIAAAQTSLTSAISTAKTEAIADAGSAADTKISTKVGDLGEKTVKKYVDDADNALSTRVDALETTSASLGKFATATEIGEADLATALKNKIDGKADTATTLTGYGITDAFTKTEVTDAIATAKGEAATAAQDKVDTAVSNLNKTDAAVDGQYVSAVSEANGIITVTRADLPNYDTLYDAKGAAAAVLGSAEDAADKDTVFGAKKAAATAQAKADAAAVAADTAKADAATANSLAQQKVASVSAKDASIVAGGTATDPTIGVQISAAEGNALSLETDGLKVTVPSAAEYSIVKDENSGDYAAIYHLTKDGTNIGAAINLPKDMVVKSGSVVTNPEGQPAGTYIELVLQNVEEPLYINVGGLIEYVTSGSATGDQIVVAVSDDHKVTATLADGSVTKAQLATVVQTSLANADSAATKITALETLVGQTAVATQITTAIGALDVDDKAIDKQFVTSVSETDGKIAVSRAAVAAIALSGSTDDLVQGTQTLIFDCGGAN